MSEISQHHEPGDLVRNPADVWPDDAPIGTFDVRRHGLQGRPSVSASILFECPRGKRCGVLLGSAQENRRTEHECNVWAWDGNDERPTITPSINCIAEKDGKPTGGCGWHGFITAGRMAP